MLKIRTFRVVDFDGLLLKPIEILENYPEVAQDYQHRIQQLMVDEFQDTNNLQMRLVSKLCSKGTTIFQWWAMMTRLFMVGEVLRLVIY